MTTKIWLRSYLLFAHASLLAGDRAECCRALRLALRYKPTPSQWGLIMRALGALAHG